MCMLLWGWECMYAYVCVCVCVCTYVPKCVSLRAYVLVCVCIVRVCVFECMPMCVCLPAREGEINA